MCKYFISKKLHMQLNEGFIHGEKQAVGRAYPSLAGRKATRILYGRPRCMRNACGRAPPLAVAAFLLVLTFSFSCPMDGWCGGINYPAEQQTPVRRHPARGAPPTLRPLCAYCQLCSGTVDWVCAPASHCLLRCATTRVAWHGMAWHV